MAADGDPQEDATGSDLSDSSGSSSSSASPAPTLPAPPPHPPPLAVIAPPASSSATAAGPLPLHSHVYFQHQQRLLSLQLSSTSTPPPGTQQRATRLPINTEALPAPPSERPFRDDCWSENATLTLIQAWGDRYLELNRGNLKQKHWKDVANSVNLRPLASSKPPKSDVQCKNRLDTLKKKYKIEKTKLVTGGAPSKWAFFDRLDELIGSAKKPKTSSSGKAPRAVASAADGNCTMNPNGQCTGISTAKCMEEDVKPPLFFLPSPANVAAAPLPGPHLVSAGSIHMNHGALHFNHHAGAAIYHHLGEGVHMNPYGGTPANHLTSGIAGTVDCAAAAVATPAPADTASKSKAGLDMSQSSPLENRPSNGKRSKRKRDRHRSEEENPFRDMARAICKFGEVYERVESAKLQQMMDVEKQRMELTKDLEIQRLQIFMQTQVELAKMKYSSSKHTNAEQHG